MSHTPWSVLKIRTRLRAGWVPWESSRGTRWARTRGHVVETQEISPGELEVLDEVMREEMGDGEQRPPGA